MISLSAEQKNSGVSRREILKAGGLFLSVFTLQKIAEVGSEFYKQAVIENRSARLPTTFYTPQDGSIALGFSPQTNFTSEGLRVATALKTSPQCFNFFIDERYMPFIYDQIKLATDHGIIPVLALGYQFGLTTNFEEFSKFLGGITKKMDSFGKPYFLRPFWEPFTPWTKDAFGDMSYRDFDSGWRKMYKQVVNSSNLAKVIYCVNSSIYTDPFNSEPFTKGFPGENFMHVFAVDTYNKYSPSSIDLEHYIDPDYSYKISLGPDILHMHKLAPNTPIAVTEFNSYNNGNKVNFLSGGANYLTELDVRLISSFDWDKNGFGEAFWNILHYPQLIAAYIQEFERSCYITNDVDLRSKPELVMDKILSKPTHFFH